ncbi:hypothetical protein IQ238_29985 [Pleurocapsales cyanobacterium LEGE 06147]|nr:hypothetical protein [Pleurocapsales cyanobacterium LEGE 06147]
MKLALLELPKAPSVSEQALAELTDYYRQLVDYHQKAAETAREKLVHLEALLEPIHVEEITPLKNGSTPASLSKSQEEKVTESLSPTTAEQLQVLQVSSTSVTKANLKKKTKTKNNSAQNKQEKSSEKNGKAVSAPSRLPKRDKMAKFDTVVTAVSQCLQANYPQAMNGYQVLHWLYPNGLKIDEKKDAYQAVSNCLVKNCGKRGWERTSIGKYVWKKRS